MAIVAPSLLAANFLHLEEECRMLDGSGADWFHLDVMDGRFVPNISYGQMVIEFMRRTTKKPFDVHLMILEPEKYAEEFRKAGADHLIVHYEACPNLHRNIEQIKSLDMKASVAINPHTPVVLLSDILQDLDTVCVMSVNPGYGAQKFIPHTLSKIRELRKLIDNWNLPVLIEVDGGVTVENAKDIIAAGADVLVAGNTVFRSKDPVDTIRQLRDIKVSKGI